MKLLYITDDEEKARVADEAGVDVIFIDLEIKGKLERQGHLDTVISYHSIENISKIKKQIKRAQLLVRVNPLDNESEYEIEKIIEQGADIIMLPMFKTKEEVEKFIKIVNKRAKICLLLETTEAFFRIKDIVEVPGIDMIHVGLNDLHLGLGLDFMFECFGGILLETVVNEIKRKNIKFGIGGVAKIGEGELPAEKILIEHIRLGSQMVILSRTFRKNIENLKEEIDKLRKEYKKSLKLSITELAKNKEEIDLIVNRIALERRKNVL